jgi:GAG-pre-integrase domain
MSYMCPEHEIISFHWGSGIQLVEVILGERKHYLITQHGQHIAQGTKIKNNLYKMKLSIRKPDTSPSKSHTMMPLTFIRCKLALSWETWHRHFGHVVYSGLWQLLDKKLVDGFHVDKHTPTPDCVACIEVKQHVKPFSKGSNRNKKPRELTH